jgi:hypothetical protein
MIRLSFVVDNISTVLQVYNQIRIQRGDAVGGPFTTVSGLGPIDLGSGQTNYIVIDGDGTASNWYQSQYYSTITYSQSSWSDPVLGDVGDLFYNPLFPDEVSYGTSQKLVIDRIRKLIGDPIGLNREYGEDAASSIHPDGKTYELDEMGYPVSIFMNGQSYNDSTNPTVNGYKYLIFNEFIDTTSVVCSGTKTIEHGVDIYYYTFRWSDRQVLEAYDTCPPPPGLTFTTANSESYMLYTAITLLGSENWHDAIEDGSDISDEGSRYSPAPGLRFREALIDDLNKKLDAVVKSLILGGISGILLD